MSAKIKNVHLVILIHGLWGDLIRILVIVADWSSQGSPAHLAAAKAELEGAWTSGKSVSMETTLSGPSEDPTIRTTVADGREEELVTMIAGGMTSTLTYDGIDVNASRVAWEVRRI